MWGQKNNGHFPLTSPLRVDPPPPWGWKGWCPPTDPSRPPAILGAGWAEKGGGGWRGAILGFPLLQHHLGFCLCFYFRRRGGICRRCERFSFYFLWVQRYFLFWTLALHFFLCFFYLIVFVRGHTKSAAVAALQTPFLPPACLFVKLKRGAALSIPPAF